MNISDKELQQRNALKGFKHLLAGYHFTYNSFVRPFFCLWGVVTLVVFVTNRINNYDDYVIDWIIRYATPFVYGYICIFSILFAIRLWVIYQCCDNKDLVVNYHLIDYFVCVGLFIVDILILFSMPKVTHLVLLGLIMAIGWIIKDRYTDIEQENTNEESEEMDDKQEQKPSIGNLLKETLTKMGYQYETGDNEDILYFACYGTQFVANLQNDKFLTIFNTYWTYVELYDIDEFARMKKVINLSNMNLPVTVFYTINEAGGRVDVHSKATFLFTNQIPSLEEYLKVYLSDFFFAHQYYRAKMEKTRENEENSQIKK